MCLIVFAWNVVPGMPLIAAGNRDEFYHRPADPAHWWDDHPAIYAGRDRQGGGAWMGITRNGRFAAVTNVRAPHTNRADAPSRGRLTVDYLAGRMAAEDYIAGIAAQVHAFNGFNLLVGDSERLIWFSNRGGADTRNGRPLPPGIYGLSNDALDTPWPKVVNTKAQFASLLCQDAPEAAYFDMLRDTERAPDWRLPNTGVDLELERMLSAVCIQSPHYGTRVSTLVRLGGRDGPLLREDPVADGEMAMRAHATPPESTGV